MLHKVSVITLSRFVDKNGNCYYSNENYQVAVRSKTIVRHIDFCFLEFCRRRPVNWPKFQIEVNFKLRRIPEKNIILIVLSCGAAFDGLVFRQLLGH